MSLLFSKHSFFPPEPILFQETFFSSRGFLSEYSILRLNHLARLDGNLSTATAFCSFQKRKRMNDAETHKRDQDALIRRDS